MWSKFDALMNDERFKHIVVFDTETTGLGKTDLVVQVSGLKLRKSDMIVVDKFDFKANPGRPIPEYTSAIHGIYTKDVLHCAPSVVVARAFCEWASDAFLLSYNGGFDTKKIAVSAQKEEIESTLNDKNVDVYTIVKALGIRGSDGKQKLESIASYLNVIPQNANFHNSMFDVEMTLRVFEKIKEERIAKSA